MSPTRSRLTRDGASRGASTVAYGLVLALVVVVSSSVSDAVGERSGDALGDRSDRVGNPDQFVAPVAETGDDGGFSGDDESEPPPSTTTVAVSGLTGETSVGSGNRWTASVTVEVAETGGGQTIAGAEVAGVWSHGAVAASCSTDSSGTCAVTQGGLKRVGENRVDETTFSVLDVTGDDLVYDSASNDPDPPEITLERP